MNPRPQNFRGVSASESLWDSSQAHARLRIEARSKIRAPFTFPLLVLLAVAAPILSLRAADDDPSDEYQLTLSPHHNIKGNLTGSGELGYHGNPELDYQAYTVLWPGLTYTADKWAQLSAGLRSVYTDNENSADKLELRPFGGVKLFLPNDLQWHLYNYTRYEFRDTQDLETHDWTSYHRIRSRLGAEFPLTSREKAWHPKTWYVLADVEPYYRFDRDTIDPLLVRGGVAYVLSDRVHLEFIYHAQFTRPAGGSSLEFSENIFRVNVKIGLHEGLLRRLQNPHHD
jgi:hypothetical protein